MHMQQVGRWMGMGGSIAGWVVVVVLVVVVGWVVEERLEEGWDVCGEFRFDDFLVVDCASSLSLSSSSDDSLASCASV